MMKEKLKHELIMINSSSNLIKAADQLSEDNAAKMLELLELGDIGDAVLFFLCNAPSSIDRVKTDIERNGEMDQRFVNHVFNVVWKLGYLD